MHLVPNDLKKKQNSWVFTEEFTLIPL